MAGNSVIIHKLPIATTILHILTNILQEKNTKPPSCPSKWSLNFVMHRPAGKIIK
jgi:hypothetical protein